jgi:hypothetical protein
MAVTRLTTNGLTGTKYDIASADNYYMEPIATTLVGSGGVSSVTFSNIPAGYKHLQIRSINRSNALCFGLLTFNSDATNANYVTHYLLGEGSSATSGGYVQSHSGILYGGAQGLGQSPNISGQVFDILDYASTTKNKTVRVLNGLDKNGTGTIESLSGVWLNSGAINRVTLSTNTSVFSEHSRFSLYGIKG